MQHNICIDLPIGMVMQSPVKLQFMVKSVKPTDEFTLFVVGNVRLVQVMSVDADEDTFPAHHMDQQAIEYGFFWPAVR